MGRGPQRHEGDLVVGVMIRANSEQRKRWHAHARASGMSLSDWARRTLDRGQPFVIVTKEEKSDG